MGFYYATGNIIQRTAWLPLRIFFAFFFKIQITGIENIQTLKSNAIFASNHIHECDPLIIVSCLPFFSRQIPLVFVSREKNFYAGLGWRGKIYGGILFKLMAALPAYTGLCDYKKALVHHINALKNGRSICIFPVGKKHHDDEIRDAKGGVSYLAAASGLAIIPVYITGATDMNYRKFWKHNGKLRVTFGKPIYFKELSGSGSTNPNKDVCEQTAVLLMEKIVTLDSYD